jgi:hypothetical protein
MGREHRPTSGLPVCAALAFLLHARHLWSLGAPGNRFYGHWERADALALLANLALTTLLLQGLWLLLRRPVLRRAPWLRAPGRYLAGISLVLSAVLAVTAGQLLWWPAWGSPPDRLDPPEPRRGDAAALDATPVYWLLFDEWSFERSTRGGRVRPILFQLSRLAERSFFFERAESPGIRTSRVVSKLLFPGEQRWQLEIGADATYWRRGEERRRTRDAASVFRPFTERGWNTALLGFYLPYRRMLGEPLDAVRSYPHAPRGDGFGERMAESALASFGFLPERWRRERYSRHWHELNVRTRRDALRVLAEWPRDTFLFVHWPLPHPPFVLESDGSYRGPFTIHRREGEEADYLRHLLHLDRVVGEIVATLERSGRLDAALLVLSSDHGWQKRDRAVRHVPLLVKWPGQRVGEVVPGRFSTLDLPGLVQLAAEGRTALADARAYLEGHAAAEGARPDYPP